MKNCTIWGDLSSDRTSENYPEGPVCDECVAENEGKEDSQIVTVGGECNDREAVCELCGKTFEEELEEKDE